LLPSAPFFSALKHTTENCLKKRREESYTQKHTIRKKYISEAQWLTTVILATPEAEIGKIIVGVHPGKKINKTFISTSSCMMACAYHPN
jgi:hypothetical protein